MQGRKRRRNGGKGGRDQVVSTLMSNSERDAGRPAIAVLDCLYPGPRRKLDEYWLLSVPGILISGSGLPRPTRTEDLLTIVDLVNSDGADCAGDREEAAKYHIERASEEEKAEKRAILRWLDNDIASGHRNHAGPAPYERIAEDLNTTPHVVEDHMDELESIGVPFEQAEQVAREYDNDAPWALCFIALDLEGVQGEHLLLCQEAEEAYGRCQYYLGKLAKRNGYGYGKGGEWSSRINLVKLLREAKGSIECALKRLAAATLGFAMLDALFMTAEACSRGECIPDGIDELLKTKPALAVLLMFMNDEALNSVESMSAVVRDAMKEALELSWPKARAHVGGMDAFAALVSSEPAK